MRAHRSVPLIFAMLAAALAGAPAAAATSPEEAVGFYNAQRQANGIPGVASLSPAMTDGCAKHVAYMKLNEYGHGETPGLPGYTPEGAHLVPEAAGNEVLAGGYLPWSALRNPWEDSPLHLFTMFLPNVTKAGYAEDGYACMRTKVGPPDTSPGPHLYSLPGPGQSVYPILDANGEIPFAPQDLIGLAGQVTGPDIVLFVEGMEAEWPMDAPPPVLHAVSYGITGPGGPVPVRIVDGTVPGWGNPAGGILIAVEPLQPFASYAAHVTWQRGDGPTAEQVIPFRTRGRLNEMEIDADPGERLVGISVIPGNPTSAYLESSIAPNVAVTLTGPGGQVLHPRWDDPGNNGEFSPGSNGISMILTHLAPGSWQACASSGGEAVGYEASTVCSSFAVRRAKRPPPRPRISVGKKLLRVKGRGPLEIAKLHCPRGGGNCRVSTPKRVSIHLDGRSLPVAALAPAKLRQGRSAPVRLKPSRAALKQLRNAWGNVHVKLALANKGRRASRNVTVTLEGPRKRHPGH